MINFIKYQRYAALFSLIMLVGFSGFAFYKYRTVGHVFTYSVDFTGGTQVLLKFDKPTSAQELQQILDNNGWTGAITRDFSPEEVMIRVKEFSSDSQGLAERMRQTIITAKPDSDVVILESMAVGPGVGETLRWKSVYTVLIALIVLLGYIMLRFFSFGYALGAVVALFHDAVIMLAAFALFNREISVDVIAAILAVLGYSINDTIVIFSKIRENLKEHTGMPLSQVVNLTLNQTMRRTLLTSISTGLCVLSMLILGGPALFNFSFALLIGIIFGTYSSIYIASPVMMLVNRKPSK